ncbi:hypothetical protein D3C78_1374790 [compost metagenome]
MTEPPSSKPSKISALAAAISSMFLKLPRWAGAIVVMIATCGRTIFTSGRISPEWFMPISNTPNSVSAGMRASVSGTPQWLLKEATAACTRPDGAKACRSISLVVVLPTEPVTAMMRADVLSRAAMASLPSAVRTSSTTIIGTVRRPRAGSLPSATTSRLAPLATAKLA